VGDGSLFAETKPQDEWLCVETGERGTIIQNVPAEDAFDFVQRLRGEYAKIKDGDHKSVKRVLARAYLAVRKMQREPDEFARLKADPFWSFPKPTDASSSRWVVDFIMQARRPSVRNLARNYVAILDRLLRDQVSLMDVRVAKMEGVEAAYESVQRQQRRVRESKSWSRRQDENG
jgi:hypothetical protein